MANFDVQVESLAGQGATLTDTEVAQWMKSGAKEIINVLPEELLYKVMKTTTLTGDNPTIPYGGVESKARIMEVLRLDADSGGFEQPCIRVHSTMYGKINDPYSIYYATYNTPAYVIHNNILSVSPPPTNAQTASVCHVDFPLITHTGGGDYDITAVSTFPSFPQEAEYLLVLYAAIKALQNKMNEMHTNTAIDTTAFDAVVRELNKVDEIINTANGKVDNFYTDTAHIDDTTELYDDTNKRFNSVRDALINANLSIDTGFATNEELGATYDSKTLSAGHWLAEEDTEMVTSTLNVAQMELNRAQIGISEISALLESYSAEHLGGVSSYLSTATGYLNQAGGYVQEISTRMSRDNQKYQWLQSEQAKLQQDYDKGLQMLITPRGAEKNAK